MFFVFLVGLSLAVSNDRIFLGFYGSVHDVF